jgi:zinc transport system substrate-binding protein
MGRRSDMRQWITVVGLAITAGTLMSGCGQQPDNPVEVATLKTRKLVVYTVNYPLSYFAERIGGDAAKVIFPEMEGDPAYWAPSPDEVSAFQKADLILLNGADYAKWVPKVSLPASRMVDTTRGSADRLIELHDEVTHTHGPGGAHAHGGFAFTTWLDPTLAIEQARAIRDALTAKRPAEECHFKDAFDELEADLIKLDRQLKSAAAAASERRIVFSHPVYQYLSQRYALNGQSVHWEPEEPPTTEMMADLKKLLADHPAAWMVWEGTPSPGSVALLKTLGMLSITFDPCGNRPATGDYLSVMNDNVAAFEELSATTARKATNE